MSSRRGGPRNSVGIEFRRNLLLPYYRIPVGIGINFRGITFRIQATKIARNSAVFTMRNISIFLFLWSGHMTLISDPHTDTQINIFNLQLVYQQKLIQNYILGTARLKGLCHQFRIGKKLYSWIGLD